MKHGSRIVLLLFLLLVAASLPSAARAQAAPAYVQPASLSVFGGLNGTYTGLSGGKNLGITAGVDLRVYNFRSYMISGEARGAYPIDDGAIDSQKDILAGVKVSHTYFGAVHPFLDILAGRGLIDYENGGFLNPAQTLIYTSSPSTVLSPGLGVDLDVYGQFALKLDAQLQHWDTPVTPSGSLYAKALTVAVVYNFNFNHPRRQRGQ